MGKKKAKRPLPEAAIFHGVDASPHEPENPRRKKKKKKKPAAEEFEAGSPRDSVVPFAPLRERSKQKGCWGGLGISPFFPKEMGKKKAKRPLPEAAIFHGVDASPHEPENPQRKKKKKKKPAAEEFEAGSPRDSVMSSAPSAGASPSSFLWSSAELSPLGRRQQSVFSVSSDLSSPVQNRARHVSDASQTTIPDDAPLERLPPFESTAEFFDRKGCMSLTALARLFASSAVMACFLGTLLRVKQRTHEARQRALVPTERVEAVLNAYAFNVDPKALQEATIPLKVICDAAVASPRKVVSQLVYDGLKLSGGKVVKNAVSRADFEEFARKFGFARAVAEQAATSGVELAAHAALKALLAEEKAGAAALTQWYESRILLVVAARRIQQRWRLKRARRIFEHRFLLKRQGLPLHFNETALDSIQAHAVSQHGVTKSVLYRIRKQQLFYLFSRSQNLLVGLLLQLTSAPRPGAALRSKELLLLSRAYGLQLPSSDTTLTLWDVATMLQSKRGDVSVLSNGLAALVNDAIDLAGVSGDQNADAACLSPPEATGRNPHRGPDANAMVTVDVVSAFLQHFDLEENYRNELVACGCLPFPGALLSNGIFAVLTGQAEERSSRGVVAQCEESARQVTTARILDFFRQLGGLAPRGRHPAYSRSAPARPRDAPLLEITPAGHEPARRRATRGSPPANSLQNIHVPLTKFRSDRDLVLYGGDGDFDSVLCCQRSVRRALFLIRRTRAALLLQRKWRMTLNLRFFRLRLGDLLQKKFAAAAGQLAPHLPAVRAACAGFFARRRVRDLFRRRSARARLSAAFAAFRTRRGLHARRVGAAAARLANCVRGFQARDRLRALNQQHAARQLADAMRGYRARYCLRALSVQCAAELLSSVLHGFRVRYSVRLNSMWCAAQMLSRTMAGAVQRHRMLLRHAAGRALARGFRGYAARHRLQGDRCRRRIARVAGGAAARVRLGAVRWGAANLARGFRSYAERYRLRAESARAAARVIRRVHAGAAGREEVRLLRAAAAAEILRNVHAGHVARVALRRARVRAACSTLGRVAAASVARRELFPPWLAFSAARRLLCVARGAAARSTLRRGIEAAAARSLLSRAASGWRGRAALRKERAAALLRRGFLGWKDRVSLGDARRRSHAVVRMQGFVRVSLAKKHVERRRVLVRRLQRVARGLLGRQQTARTASGLRVLQRLGRGMAARSHVASLKRKFRCLLRALRKFLARLRATRALQRISRGGEARTQVRRVQGAVHALQKVARGLAARQQTRCIARITALQRIGTGVRARLLVAKRKHASRVLRRVMAGFTSRTLTFRRRSAAGTACRRVFAGAIARLRCARRRRAARTLRNVAEGFRSRIFALRRRRAAEAVCRRVFAGAVARSLCAGRQRDAAAQPFAVDRLESGRRTPRGTLPLQHLSGAADASHTKSELPPQRKSRSVFILPPPHGGDGEQEAAIEKPLQRSASSVRLGASTLQRVLTGARARHVLRRARAELSAFCLQRLCRGFSSRLTLSAESIRRGFSEEQMDAAGRLARVFRAYSARRHSCRRRGENLVRGVQRVIRLWRANLYTRRLRIKLARRKSSAVAVQRTWRICRTRRLLRRAEETPAASTLKRVQRGSASARRLQNAWRKARAVRFQLVAAIAAQQAGHARMETNHTFVSLCTAVVVGQKALRGARRRLRNLRKLQVLGRAALHRQRLAVRRQLQIYNAATTIQTAWRCTSVEETVGNHTRAVPLIQTRVPADERSDLATQPPPPGIQVPTDSERSAVTLLQSFCRVRLSRKVWKEHLSLHMAYARLRKAAGKVVSAAARAAWSVRVVRAKRRELAAALIVAWAKMKYSAVAERLPRGVRRCAADRLRAVAEGWKGREALAQVASRRQAAAADTVRVFWLARRDRRRAKAKRGILAGKSLRQDLAADVQQFDYATALLFGWLRPRLRRSLRARTRRATLGALLSLWTPIAGAAAAIAIVTTECRHAPARLLILKMETTFRCELESNLGDWLDRSAEISCWLQSLLPSVVEKEEAASRASVRAFASVVRGEAVERRDYTVYESIGRDLIRGGFEWEADPAAATAAAAGAGPRVGRRRRFTAAAAAAEQQQQPQDRQHHREERQLQQQPYSAGTPEEQVLQQELHRQREQQDRQRRREQRQQQQQQQPHNAGTPEEQLRQEFHRYREQQDRQQRRGQRQLQQQHRDGQYEQHQQQQQQQPHNAGTPEEQLRQEFHRHREQQDRQQRRGQRQLQQQHRDGQYEQHQQQHQQQQQQQQPHDAGTPEEQLLLQQHHHQPEPQDRLQRREQRRLQQHRDGQPQEYQQQPHNAGTPEEQLLLQDHHRQPVPQDRLQRREQRQRQQQQQHRRGHDQQHATPGRGVLRELVPEGGRHPRDRKQAPGGSSSPRPSTEKLASAAGGAHDTLPGRRPQHQQQHQHQHQHHQHQNQQQQHQHQQQHHQQHPHQQQQYQQQQQQHHQLQHQHQHQKQHRQHQHHQQQQYQQQQQHHELQHQHQHQHQHQKQHQHQHQQQHHQQHPHLHQYQQQQPYQLQHQQPQQQLQLQRQRWNPDQKATPRRVAVDSSSSGGEDSGGGGEAARPLGAARSAEERSRVHALQAFEGTCRQKTRFFEKNLRRAVAAARCAAEERRGRASLRLRWGSELSSRVDRWNGAMLDPSAVGLISLAAVCCVVGVQPGVCSLVVCTRACVASALALVVRVVAALERARCLLVSATYARLALSPWKLSPFEKGVACRTVPVDRGSVVDLLLPLLRLPRPSSGAAAAARALPSSRRCWRRCRTASVRKGSNGLTRRAPLSPAGHPPRPALCCVNG
ncbi:hypothetical protein DIPPA_12930 [Diplonema papillatum]|nr:hypothetical protein DIPPA_12930 [Diplonema papillatum]